MCINELRVMPVDDRKHDRLAAEAKEQVLNPVTPAIPHQPTNTEPVSSALKTNSSENKPNHATSTMTFNKQVISLKEVPNEDAVTEKV